MKKFTAKIFLGLMGWKVKAKVTEQTKHSVMIAAPHTSNWDFPIALAAFWIMGLDVKFFIKDEYTKGLFGWFFKWTGALGVDRNKKKNNLTAFAIDLLQQKKIVVIVPAEGTRARVEKWRTGFYRIAVEAKVPISLGTLDYKEKFADILDVFMPTGNFEEDMLYIQEQYKVINARFPENYNQQIF